MKKLKLIALFAISIALTNNTEALTNSKAKSALTKKASKTIICSPDGNEDGSVSISTAISKLRKGMRLKILPGDYKNKEYKINVDYLIIEGTPREKCIGLNLELSGRGNIIRNLWMYYLLVKNELTVVNSVIYSYVRFDTNSDSRKADINFDNSILPDMYIYDYYGKSKITITNCTLIQDSSSGELLDLSYDSTIHISNSILYSSSAIFECSGTSDIPEVKLKDCIIHFETHLGSFDNNSSSSKKKDTIIHKLTDLRKICKARSCSKNIIKKIKLKSLIIKPENCQPETPFKDKGAHLSDEWFEEEKVKEEEEVNNSISNDDNESNTNSEIVGNLTEEDKISIDPKDGFFQNITNSYTEYNSKSISIVKGKHSNTLKSIKKYQNFELEYDMNISTNTGRYYSYLIFRRDDDFSCRITFADTGNRFYTTALNKPSISNDLNYRFKTKNKFYLLCKDNSAMLKINGEVVANIKLEGLSNAGRFGFYGSSRSSSKSNNSTKTIKIENIKFKSLDE